MLAVPPMNKIWKILQILFKGGVTSLIDFQSLFIQTKGNGMFNSVIKLVIVLHYYIFWRETVNKMTMNIFQRDIDKIFYDYPLIAANRLMQVCCHRAVKQTYVAPNSCPECTSSLETPYLVSLKMMLRVQA